MSMKVIISLEIYIQNDKGYNFLYVIIVKINIGIIIMLILYILKNIILF